VLLLDEPFSALDDDTRATVRDLVRMLTERHRWITILVSHHADDVAALALRRYRIGGGMLVEA
jgi:thiamine transport system ATP-binding protein